MYVYVYISKTTYICIYVYMHMGTLEIQRLAVARLDTRMYIYICLSIYLDLYMDIWI